MRRVISPEVERRRIRSGPFGSDASYGNNGAFQLDGPLGRELMLVVSDGGGWEHVSVSIHGKMPTWKEMSFVKDLFWTDDEAVMQLHPPRAEYVNNHETCLHLWRPTDQPIPLPPSEYVGDKSRGILSREEAEELLNELRRQ